MSSIINAGTSGLVLTGSTTTTLSLATNGTTRATIDASGNVSLASGNLTFSSTGQRITGDFSNATATSRLAFQSSTTNGNTIIQAIPNGTATQTNLLLYANTDLSNSAALNIFQNATESTIRGIALGTGAYTPLTFYTGGSERMRLDTSGNLGLATATASYRFTLQETGGSTFNREFVLRNGDQTNFWRLSQGRNLTTATSGIPSNSAFVVTENGGGYGASGGLTIGTIESAPLTAITGGTARMTIDSSGKITDQYGNIRAIPQSGSDKTTSYTLATTDVGRFIGVGSGGSITVPDATFATGDVVSIFNNTTGNVTLTMTITTAYIGGTNTDKATITLATRGVATVLFISGTVCVVNGNVS